MSHNEYCPENTRENESILATGHATGNDPSRPKTAAKSEHTISYFGQKVYYINPLLVPNQVKQENMPDYQDEEIDTNYILYSNGSKRV